MVRHRLYIDEVGNADLESSRHPNERYLSLTGVRFDYTYAKEVVHPRLEAIKRTYFDYHPDDPIILHRKEILNKKIPFDILLDPKMEVEFNRDVLSLLTELEYTVFTVVIDKLEHLLQYKTWHYNPYHYCQEILLERYVLWLEQNEAVGDVLAESRGGKEDRRLKDSFNRLYRTGSEYVPIEKFQKRLTSCQLKVKNKANNIAGLQIADLIAYPSFKTALLRHQKLSVPENFGGKIAKILLADKYYRSSSNRIDGWGIKWLP